MSDAYVDYAVELANRWLRSADVCVYVSERHVASRRDAYRPVTDKRMGARLEHEALAVQVVVGADVRDREGDVIRGWARSGRRIPYAIVNRDNGSGYTLAHELGHVLGLEHVSDDDHPMHGGSPAVHEQVVGLSPSERRRVHAAALELERVFGRRSPSCMAPVALADPAAIPSGHPVLTHVSGDDYTGELLFGIRHGRGTQRSPSGYRFSGEYVLGERHGHGVERHSSGGEYAGEFHRGKRHGLGTYTYSDGDVYVGDWEHNQRTGYGHYRFAEGGSYHGRYRRGARHGAGIFRWGDGRWESRRYHEGRRAD